MAWQIDNALDNQSGASFATRLQSLLEVMASWPETRRLGFYSAASVDQLNHPSQTLERVEEPLDQLRKGLIGVQGRLQEPTLVQWS